MANFIPRIRYTDPDTLMVVDIDFELPPEGDLRTQNIDAVGRTTKSDSGIEQTQHNYFEETRQIKFTFITEALKTATETFFKKVGGKGVEFSYFESNDEIEFFTVTLDNKQFRPRILFRSGGAFEYEFTLNIRRVVT